MLTYVSCWLNNVGLQDLDESIAVTDIQETPPNVTRNFISAVRLPGSRMVYKHRDSLIVKITVVIREPDPARRQAVCQEINRWASAGGYLTTADRPGQRLLVVQDAPLMTQSVMRWTQYVTLTFAAYERPWWEEEQATAVSFAAAKTTHSGTMNLPGTAESARAEAEIVPAASGSGDVTVTVGDTSITLKGLTLTAGQAVRIGYDERGLLEIRNGSASVMGSRSAESDDDLLAVPGRANAVSVSAPVAVTAKISARGCWL